MNVLAPVTLAPMQAAIAECSLSTGMYWLLNSPDVTYSAICSTISVCGVMGYAATTDGQACFTAAATALLPVATVSISLPPLFSGAVHSVRQPI
ncbi:MAG: hypothetical protein A4E40_00585 [Methanoregulaceae archaeon PtaU1.Bin059]|nr:MAG: hypothetical protein A4E40_00585 [Methanoregulaceae archaeon PtaU1.Bin059]